MCRHGLASQRPVDRSKYSATWKKRSRTKPTFDSEGRADPGTCSKYSEHVLFLATTIAVHNSMIPPPAGTINSKTFRFFGLLPVNGACDATELVARLCAFHNCCVEPAELQKSLCHRYHRLDHKRSNMIRNLALRMCEFATTAFNISCTAGLEGMSGNYWAENLLCRAARIRSQSCDNRW